MTHLKLPAIALLSAFLLTVPAAFATQHPSFPQFASPIAAYTISKSTVSFPGNQSVDSITVTITDSAIYRYVNTSYNGQNWVQRTLSAGTPSTCTTHPDDTGGTWLTGTCTLTVPLSAANFSFTAPGTTKLRNYITAYSCTENVLDLGIIRFRLGWDCHGITPATGMWQIWNFSASLAQTCGNGTCDSGESCSSCPADCGACQTCGNSAIEGTEQCDCGTDMACTSAELAGATCASRLGAGYTGMLNCTASCTFNTSFCVSSCTPNCTGKACGSDGCGGSCGTCSTGYVCQTNGTCAREDTNLKYIVQNGVGYADIVVSSSAPNMVQLAANYFRMYINNLTGAVLPISNTPSGSKQYHVYIGRSTYTDSLGITSVGCKDGGFKMVSGNNYLVLLGDDKAFTFSGPTDYAEWDALTGDLWGNSFLDGFYNYNNGIYGIWEADGRGSMNAVHEFLYNQGIRWYAPGAIGTIIPAKSNVSFGNVNSTINPDFSMRNFYFYGREFGQLNTNNALFVPNYKLEDELKWQMSLRSTGFLDYTGNSLAHGMNTLLGRDAMKSAHREYYAIWDGTRMNVGWDIKADLCSQALFEDHVRYIKAMFDTYDIPAVNVMPTDGFYAASESSLECKAKETYWRGMDGWISDYVWEYINNLAWAIHDAGLTDSRYANKNISCSAYTTYYLPPLNLSRPLAPNLIIMLSRDRLGFEDEEKQAYEENVTNTWLAMASSKQQIYTYTYYLNNVIDTQTQSVPAFFPHIISEDLQFLNGKSKGEAIELNTNYGTGATNPSWDTFAANSFNVYVTARLYWDADQDVDALLNEYYTLYYGPASTQMKTFVNYSEAHYGQATEDPVVMRTMRQMLTSAKTTAGNTIYGQRIDKLIALVNSNFAGEEVLISSCQTLTSPTTIYKLTADVSSTGTCFTVETFGITIDCQGHAIAYGTNGVRGDWERNGITIKNCTMQGTGSAGYGVYISRSMGTRIENSRINTGIFFDRVNGTNVAGSTITSSGSALFYQFGGDGTITNSVLSSASDNGLYLYATNSLNVTRTNASSGACCGATITQSNNNVFTDNRFTSATGRGVQEWESSGNVFLRNTILPP
jgi:hypothetical protein